MATELTSDISERIEHGDQTEACLLDFSKAFDKVNHQQLIRTVTVTRTVTDLEPEVDASWNQKWN